MHPALKLSSISKLPPSLRARAQAAATGTHPTEIFDLVNDLTACRMPTEYFSGFLPVFYVLLEPARIPEILRQLENPDLSSSHYKIPMTRLIAEAVYSLRGIEILDMRDSIVAAALVDLWDRVSPWILFLDEYGELFGGGKWYDPPNRYALFVGLLRAFRKSPAVERLVYKTHGFLGVVGKAWRLVLDAAKANSGPWNRINEFALEDISRFLAQWAGYLDNVKWDSTGFDELLFGAGGTRADLASLVVGHINYFVPTTETKLTSTTILHLIGLIESVGSTSVLVHGLFDIEFRNALLSQGIVTTLTRFSIALSHSGPMSVVEHPLTWMLAALTDYLCIFPRHRWIIEALRAGLLPAIFACAAPRFKNSTFQSIEFLLGSLLPTSTVYHSVLSQLRTSLEHVSSTNPFAASGNKKFLKQWQSLLALAEDHFKIVEQYNRGGSISMRMRTCDNLKCLKLSPKKELQACSGCASAVYCSQPCQIADWNNGHRDGCEDLRARRRRQSHLSARDRSFLQALVHHDYLAHREEIAKESMKLREGNPASTPHIYVAFDYANGPCYMEIGQLEELRDTGFGVPEDISYGSLKYDITRTLESEGALILHSMRIVEGGDGRNRGDNTEDRIWTYQIRPKTFDLESPSDARPQAPESGTDLEQVI
ncbi:hypothetical protein R3P38DRAFT_2593050 [Favolaschia claudopus]|uniref:MYND-type domain-containing protein n=1 Tax=Favolaschia claudopus TaxID=2862362 RepID=A0AAW0EE76_9AGAR